MPVFRAVGACCLALAVAVLATGCSSSGPPAAGPAVPRPAVTFTVDPSAAAVPTATAFAPPPAPRPHLVDAVRDFLAAEQRKDRTASFRLLSVPSRAEYPDVADWTTRRLELPPITGFTIDPGSDAVTGDRDGKVQAIVTHVPGLDPFKGLSAARERQVFAGRRTGQGWLVDAEPVTEALLPPDSDAVAAAVAWARAVQACDKARAAGMQAVSLLFGFADGSRGLCRKAGAVTAAGAMPMVRDAVSASIVTQYGEAALTWARVVRITAPTEFGVLLAPIGSTWKVLGLTA